MFGVIQTMSIAQRLAGAIPAPTILVMAAAILLSSVASAQVNMTPVDVGAVPDDAVISISGLASRVLEPGSGSVHPTMGHRVLVHYTGWTTDGEMFDSSVERGSPAWFPLTAVIEGFAEGITLMVVGERRRMWIPGDLAYGRSPRAGVPSGMLVFDVELIEIELDVRHSGREAFETHVAERVDVPPPPDVAAPPAEATVLDSGLALIQLEPGYGTVHPERWDRVRFEATGWAVDGTNFEASLGSHARTEVLRDLMLGLHDALRLMVEGERVRVWIPDHLTDEAGSEVPDGMLVYELRVVSISKAD